MKRSNNITKKNIAIISGDIIGEKMAGPGMRYFNISLVLSRYFNVHLLSPNAVSSSFTRSNPKIKFYNYEDFDSIIKFIETKKLDYIFTQSMSFDPILTAMDHKIKIIYDLYNPLPIEAIQGDNYKEANFNDNYQNLLNSMLLYSRSGSYFVAANERQRDFWLGVLTQNGYLLPKLNNNIDNIDQIIGLLPFGISDIPPKKTSNSLRGVVKGIDNNSKIVLWTGGIWDWFDPLVVIEAIAKLSITNPEIKLVFYGTKHPNPIVTQKSMSDKARGLSDKLLLTGKNVFFLEGWVNNNLRQNYLLEADVLVSSHFNTLETRLSFRTRILDHLWVEKPTVCTKGDYFAEQIEEYGLGYCVDYSDVDGFKNSILRAIYDQDVGTIKKNISKYKEKYYWANTCSDLIKYILNDKTRPFDNTARVNDYIDLSSLSVIKKNAKKIHDMRVAKKNLIGTLKNPSFEKIKLIPENISEIIHID